MSNDFIESSYREKLLEHLLIGELLKWSWRSKKFVEVSRPEVDRSGYDIILECDGVVRHVQIKTRKKEGERKVYSVHTGLGRKASGCVVVIFFDEDLKIGPFLFFGDEPGKPLCGLGELPVARHTKPNKQGIKTERPDHRIVGGGKFTQIEDLEGLVSALFG